jgi:hypothetical protein
MVLFFTIGLGLIPFWTSIFTLTQQKETFDELAI